MIAGVTYYQICWIFLIYSFLGWIVEVMFHAVSLGKIVNRGFLNGPVCPVYGFGVLGITMLTSGLKQHQTKELSIWALFLLGIVVATVIELIAGWLLNVLFHARWWDYSNRKFNFHGYICPQFSVIWGATIVVIIKVLQPMGSESSLFQLPEKYGWPILAVIYLAYFADLVVTVAVVQNMNRRLQELDQVRNSMRIVSDRLSEVVAGTTIKASQKIEEGQVQAALATAELRDTAVQKTTELRESAAQKTTELKDSAVQKTTELKDTAVQKTTELKDSAVQKTTELKDTAVQKTAELKDSAVQKTTELRTRAAQMKETALQKKDEMVDAAADYRDDTIESLILRKNALQRRADELAESMTHATFGTRRIMKAFPRMLPGDYRETWNELKERLRRNEPKK